MYRKHVRVCTCVYVCIELPWPSDYELRLSLERSRLLILVKVIGRRQEGHPVRKCPLLQQKSRLTIGHRTYVHLYMISLCCIWISNGNHRTHLNNLKVLVNKHAMKRIMRHLLGLEQKDNSK